MAYDALDLMWGIEVFLNCVPWASLVALRRGLRSIGITSPQVIETTYGTRFLDLAAWRPTVIESPPASLCVVDDIWFRYVSDNGIAGPDKARAAPSSLVRQTWTLNEFQPIDA